MRTILVFCILVSGLAGCNSKNDNGVSRDNSDTLLDSAELKMKADTVKDQIMHIGDSLEQMQRKAEADARKSEL